MSDLATAMQRGQQLWQKEQQQKQKQQQQQQQKQQKQQQQKQQKQQKQNQPTKFYPPHTSSTLSTSFVASHRCNLPSSMPQFI